MNDDIKAIRDALAAGPTPGPWVHAVDFGQLGSVEANGTPVAQSQQRFPLDNEQRQINAAFIAACNPQAIAALLKAIEVAQKDAARYLWLRQVAEGEAADGEHSPLIKLYGLHGYKACAFLNKAPHMTEAIDAAMAEGK